MGEVDHRDEISQIMELDVHLGFIPLVDIRQQMFGITGLPKKTIRQVLVHKCSIEKFSLSLRLGHYIPKPFCWSDSCCSLAPFSVDACQRCQNQSGAAPTTLWTQWCSGSGRVPRHHCRRSPGCGEASSHPRCYRFCPWSSWTGSACVQSRSDLPRCHRHWGSNPMTLLR